MCEGCDTRWSYGQGAELHRILAAHRAGDRTEKKTFMAAIAEVEAVRSAARHLPGQRQNKKVTR